MIQPSDSIIGWLLLLDFILILLTIFCGFWNIIFLIFSLIFSYFAMPLGFRKGIFDFLLNAGIVKYVNRSNESYLNSWPKVLFTKFHGYYYFRIYHVTFDENENFRKLVRESFGLYLVDVKKEYGYYEFQLSDRPKREFYKF